MGREAFEIWGKEGLAEKWREMIKPIFPSNAILSSEDDGSYFIISVKWRLNDDLEQNNKGSRRINLKFSEAFIEDEGTREEEGWDEKLRKLIEEKFRDFNHEHDKLGNQYLPPVTWSFGWE